jgi:hypothetical protein
MAARRETSATSHRARAREGGGEAPEDRPGLGGEVARGVPRARPDRRACRAADVSRATVWRRRQADEDFALAFAEAERDVLAMLEDEAVRRALHGVERPVAIGGERELVRHYSDSLLAMLLRSRAPERYVDRHRLEHGGRIEHEHALYDPDAVELSDELRARVRRLLRRRKG